MKKTVKWFRNMRVAYKILFCCSILLLMLSVIVAFSIISTNQIKNSVKDYSDNSVTLVIKMDAVAKNFLQARIDMYEMDIASRDKDYKKIKKLKDYFMSLREENKKLIKFVSDIKMTDKERKLMEQYSKLHSEFGTLIQNYFDAIDRGNNNEIISAMNEWLAKYDQAKIMRTELQELSVRTGAEKIASAFENIQSIIFYTTVIFICSIITGLLITLILSRGISKPVNMCLAFANQIAEGDFSDRIDIDQKDEIGILSHALNTSADKLEATISGIMKSTDYLVQSVEQIAAGNQNLSQRTSEQAGSLEEIAATVEQAKISINQNYENSINASSMSSSSTKTALQGGELVNETVQSINDVNTNTNKIGEISILINEIAFQTNLLALNAAVEAARAGEHGKGFAVVASEVRNLAQKAANSTKDIANIINEAVIKVQDSTDKTYKSGESLKNIIASVKGVEDLIRKIELSSNDQKQGMEQISETINNLDIMTQHNASLVEETASASEEMAGQARELMNMMSQFKIRALTS